MQQQKVIANYALEESIRTWLLPRQKPVVSYVALESSVVQEKQVARRALLELISLPQDKQNVSQLAPEEELAAEYCVILQVYRS